MIIPKSTTILPNTKIASTFTPILMAEDLSTTRQASMTISIAKTDLKIAKFLTDDSPNKELLESHCIVEVADPLRAAIQIEAAIVIQFSKATTAKIMIKVMLRSSEKACIERRLSILV